MSQSVKRDKLTDLPPEMLIRISEYCPRGVQAVLARTSRGLHRAITPILYRDITLASQSEFANFTRTILETSSTDATHSPAAVQTLKDLLKNKPIHYLTLKDVTTPQDFGALEILSGYLHPNATICVPKTGHTLNTESQASNCSPWDALRQISAGKTLVLDYHAGLREWVEGDWRWETGLEFWEAGLFDPVSTAESRLEHVYPQSLTLCMETPDYLIRRIDGGGWVPHPLNPQGTPEELGRAIANLSGKTPELHLIVTDFENSWYSIVLSDTRTNSLIKIIKTVAVERGKGSTFNVWIPNLQHLASYPNRSEEIQARLDAVLTEDGRSVQVQTFETLRASAPRGIRTALNEMFWGDEQRMNRRRPETSSAPRALS